MSTSSSHSINESQINQHRGLNKPLYLLLSLFAVALIIGVVYLSLPSIRAGVSIWSSYLKLSWAHDGNQIQVLVEFSLMLWLSFSALFFGGWLLKRSLRKLKGMRWSVSVGKSQQKKIFPPMLVYLKLSCFFLATIFLFVVLQYPIQFILYP